MSVQAITWALQQQVVADAGARHVLIGLANHADNKGRHAFPSVSLLCSYTGLKRRTVLEKLKVLQGLGVITRGNQRIAETIIERADRRPVVYDIQMDFENYGKRDCDENEVVERDVNAAPRDNSPGAAKTSRSGDGVQIAAVRGAGSAPEPSLTKKIHTHLETSLSYSRDKYRLNYEWEPNLEMFYESCVRRNMGEVVKPKSEELANFIGFYSETDRCHTERGWNDLLARWCSDNRKRKSNKKVTENSGVKKGPLLNGEKQQAFNKESMPGRQSSEKKSRALPQAELAERLGQKRADAIVKQYGSDKVGTPAVEEMRRTLRT
ncbi:helix-turn-helix domain-containing protein [Vreelandella aquamarina]